MTNLNEVYINILNGNVKLTDKEIKDINDIAIDIYNKKSLSNEDKKNLELIIRLSNVLYNNTSSGTLPLDDGFYDLLLEKYKGINPNFEVGASNIKGGFVANNGDGSRTALTKFNAVTKINKNYDEPYIDSIRETQKFITYQDNSIGSNAIHRNREISHEYPELVGTLDKCKFVLDIDAKERGVYNDSNVKIFERDFLGRQLQDGLITMNQNIPMVCELKYDGISVEATVSNRVISARTRGDLKNDKAVDLTDVLYGYRFPNNISDDEAFGVKFEAVITKYDLYKFMLATGKKYSNERVAIAGILNSKNARDYLDYITLVPLATSIPEKFANRLAEINFLNTYFATKIKLKYVGISGTPVELLYRVKKFTESAEKFRDFMPVAYDGVVVSHIDKYLISSLGRENHINKYSISIKFNPLKRRSRFRGYKYSVGKNGVITPIIFFDPVEMNGAIFNKVTGHSYDTFLYLGLRYNDIIEITYINDVMPQVKKVDCEENDQNTNPKIPFPDVCPVCGSKLELSESGKSAYCPNKKECKGILTARITDMLKILNFKDFSIESVSKLNIHNFREFMNLKEEDLIRCGIVGVYAKKFMERLNTLKTKKLLDSTLVGSLGFFNISTALWDKVLSNVSLDEIINTDDNILKYKLCKIKSIGNIYADIICNERKIFIDDLKYIYSMPNVVKCINTMSKVTVCFTGIRDKELEAKLKDEFIKISNSVTKDTDILVVPYKGYESSKTKKAEKYGIKQIDIDTFRGGFN